MEQKYLFVAVDAALRAGEKILSIYNDPKSDFEIERKADNSPLTIADRKAHETIAMILNETPFPVLSEEGKHLDYEVRKGWNTLWIVDPLDGTKEFIKRNGEFTVNIALVYEGIPVLGVIYLPVKQESRSTENFRKPGSHLPPESSIRVRATISWHGFWHPGSSAKSHMNRYPMRLTRRH